MPNCRSCGASIIFARSTNNKPLPLDARPVHGGNIELRRGVAHYVGVDVNARTPRYVSHFATCPKAEQHRKAKA